MATRFRNGSGTPSGSANLADVFPYGSCTTATMDLDHTKPYLPMNRGGPPGQTSLANLGPMTRYHHRAVTHGHWEKRQPAPGRTVPSPMGYHYLVTNQGTLTLGKPRSPRRSGTPLQTSAPTPPSSQSILTSGLHVFAPNVLRNNT